jgi:dihydrofolate reductase
MSKKIIVATDENGLIGKDNQIPWHMPVDLKYFKETTTGQVVIMGSNTYYSLGKPLPNRKNVVISSRDLQIEGVEIFKTLEEALKKYDDCFIIGGAKIYKYAIENNLVDEIYLTRIYHKFEKGDAYFNFDDSIWKAYSFKFIPKDEKNIYDSAYLIFRK